MVTSNQHPGAASATLVRSSAGVVRIGYVPLIDAAPLLMAEALGLFRDEGLRVRLDRELGWGSVREKLSYGELDAAHAPGGLLASILCGTHSRPGRVSTNLVLSFQGNAITLSRRLWNRGVRDAASLREMLAAQPADKIPFAVVSPFASHLHILRLWLLSGGIDPENDVRIVILPPPLMGEHLREGHIEGFCAGEPWNSAVTFSGDAWIAATSATLAPLHPEKVLLAGEELTQERPDEYAALRRAIHRACKYCESKAGRAEAVEMLHARKLFPVGREVLKNALVGPFQTGAKTIPDTAPFIHFSKASGNRASRQHARWFLNHLECTGTAMLTAGQSQMCLDAFHDDPLPTATK